MSIQHIIIHEIRRIKANTQKESSEDQIVCKIKEIENDLSKLDSDLKIELVKLFSKATSLYVGEFAINGDTSSKPVFEQKLENFYDGTKCLNFTDLTIELANHFKKILEDDKRINGGYLVFFEYLVSDDIRLAIAVINKTKGTDVDNELNFIVREILDIDKLHLGATINISDWADGLSSRYIRFKKGNASEVRDYFEEFVGCTLDKNAAKAETQNLKTAIELFVRDELQEDQDEIDIKLLETHSYITDLMKNNEEILLHNVANKIFPNMADRFFEYASNTHNISDQITISKSVLAHFRKLSSRNKDLNLSFSRHLINKKITRNNGKLIIDETLLTEAFLKEMDDASTQHDDTP